MQIIHDTIVISSTNKLIYKQSSTWYSLQQTLKILTKYAEVLESESPLILNKK